MSTILDQLKLDRIKNDQYIKTVYQQISSTIPLAGIRLSFYDHTTKLSFFNESFKNALTPSSVQILMSDLGIRQCIFDIITLGIRH